MLAADEDALICDLAEVYGVLSYRALPVSLLATLACGLREDTRIRMAMAGATVPRNTMLIAAAVDKLAWLVWSKSKDAQRNRNHPKSILQTIMGDGQGQGSVDTYCTANDFEEAKRRILGVNHGD